MFILVFFFVLVGTCSMVCVTRMRLKKNIQTFTNKNIDFCFGILCFMYQKKSAKANIDIPKNTSNTIIVLNACCLRTNLLCLHLTSSFFENISF